MKILRIVSSGFEEGGVENGVVLLQPLFEAKGHIIKIFSSDAREDLPHYNHYSYKSPPLNGFGKLFYTFNPYAYMSLKKTLKEFKPDLIHIHTIGNASPAILFLLKSYPVVYTIHGPETFIKSLFLWCFPKTYFKTQERVFKNLNLAGKFRYLYQKNIDLLLYKYGLRNVKLFITLSKYMHELIKEEGISNTYISNATTLFDYKPLSDQEITNKLTYVGRLEVYKGVDYLLQALPKIIKAFPNTHLFIAGVGSEKENLINLVVDLNIVDYVSFLGQLNRDQLEKLYQKTSVVVVPSIWPEAFGKIGIEAMSVGRPVVASDVGGISDWLINGETGFLVPPKDSSAISRSVIDILSNKPLFLSMTKKARKKAEEFDLKKHADQMDLIYRNLIIPKQKVGFRKY